MKISGKIFAAATALTIIALTGCGSKDNKEKKVIYYDDSNSYSQETENFENPDGSAYDEAELIKVTPTTPAKLNEEAEVSGISLILKNVYDAGEIELNDDMKTKKQVIALNCEVTNNTSSEITVNSFNFTIRYINGEYAMVETGLREEMSASKKIKDIHSLNAVINTGETASGYASLSVPLDWQSLTVYFTPLGLNTNDALTYEITRDMLETQ